MPRIASSNVSPVGGGTGVGVADGARVLVDNTGTYAEARKRVEERKRAVASNERAISAWHADRRALPRVAADSLENMVRRGERVL